jgi:hypothetical protein
VGFYNVPMGAKRLLLARLTRRQWTALISCTPLAAAQITSTVPPTGSPKPAGPDATPDQRMEKATSDVREASALLAKIEVPMNVEPAFVFRA